MTIQRITYASSVDALTALVRSLVAYERRHNLASAHFYARYEKGELGGSEEFIEWAGDYQHYLQLKEELEHKLAATG